MSTPFSVGYLLPEPARLRPSPPEIRYGGRLIGDDRVAPDWHYLTDVTVEWNLEVDLDGLLKDTGLTPDASIGALLTWRSGRTNLRGGGPTTVLGQGANLLSLYLPGTELGGTVHIEARVVLCGPGAGAEPLSPRRPGSLLWSTSEQVMLEGSGGRFPTTASDFATTGLPGGESAPWYLEILESDLEASATACLRLHLNSSNEDVRELLERPDSDRSRFVLRHLRHDTTRQILAAALRNDEFDDRVKYGRGTLGDVLVALVRVHFPGRSIDQLRADYGLHAAEVDAELLASVWRGER